MKKDQIRPMCISGIFTALVFAVTAYLHIPTYNGYVHIGDGFIFLAACFLPMPYAIFTGAVGAMLADLLTRYAIWAPGSMIIKSLVAMLFTSKGKKILTRRNAWMLLSASAISIVGYYLYEALITGSFAASLSGIPGSALQATASSLLFAVTGLALDKLSIKGKIGVKYL